MGDPVIAPKFWRLPHISSRCGAVGTRLPSDEYANAFFGFKAALELLLGRPVDLVVESAIRNPYFLQSIEQGKALLYAA